MTDKSLSPEETRRYGRHLVMPEVGVSGQKRLKHGSVLIVGVGGLGSPIALYLAAAGVGRIGLVDSDLVELTNVQRQVLYATEDVGRPKVEIAHGRLSALNPNVEVITYPIRLTSRNARSIIRDYDIVADGSDNFPTRYLVNDACVLLGKPNVHGSIFRFEGQITVFDASRGPCYRCLFPEPPPAGATPSCAQAGVLGVLPGIVGSLQALEVLKLLLVQGEPLIGRSVLIDTLSFDIREVRLRKDPACAICGESPTIRELTDYEDSCLPSQEQTMAGETVVPEVTPEEVWRRMSEGEKITLLDVREPPEAGIAKLEGSILIPLGDLTDRLTDLDRQTRIVIYCHTGVRSMYAVRTLLQAGFSNVWNLTGGIDAWSLRVDRSILRY